MLQIPRPSDVLPERRQKVVTIREELFSDGSNFDNPLPHCVGAANQSIGLRGLMNNETARALATMPMSKCLRGDRNGERSWKTSKPEEVGEIAEIAQDLFNVFTDLEMPETDRTGFQDEYWPSSTLRGKVASLMCSTPYITFSVLLTLWALFSEDFFNSRLMSSQTNPALAGINTVVFLFYCFETIARICLSSTWKRAFFDLRLLLDLAACVSVVRDSIIGYYLYLYVQSNSQLKSALSHIPAVAQTLLRAARMGQLTQVLRVLPRLWQKSDTRLRALVELLFAKRLWRLFSYMDAEDKGFISVADAHSMLWAFQEAFPDDASPWSFRRRVKSILASPFKSWSSALVTAALDLGRLKKGPQGVSFDDLLDFVVDWPPGEAAMNVCYQDLSRVQDSFTLLHKASLNVALKVSLTVLLLLIAVPLLGASPADLGNDQVLAQLDGYAQISTNATSMCQIVQDMKLQRSHFVWLVLKQRTYIGPGCDCCNNVVTSPRGTQGSEVISSLGVPYLARKVVCVSGDCSSESQSWAFLDQSAQVQDAAVSQLTVTLTVLAVMMVAIFLFNGDVRSFSTEVMHPLWVLLDEMSALRSLDMVLKKDLDRVTGKDKAHARILCCKLPSDRRYTKILSSLMNRATSCSATSGNLEGSEELIQLQAAFGKMRGALRSWSKFVPVTLINQLVVHGLEAGLGVCQADAAILFCDIVGFELLCIELPPEELLVVMSHIFSEICDVVERSGGTVLEFIGDEILSAFNVPCPVIGYKELACTAAVEVLERRSRFPIPDLRLRVGLHSAKVLAGNIGSPQRIKYGMLGDGVNTAARIKSLNSHLGTQCLVSEACLTSDVDDGFLVTRPLGRYVLKGRQADLGLSELLCKSMRAPPEAVEAAETFRKAMQEYEGRNFESALKLFREANEFWAQGPDGGEDLVSRRYMGRCQEYLLFPPPIDWRPVEVMGKK